jgi:hypothetical protein
MTRGIITSDAKVNNSEFEKKNEQSVSKRVGQKNIPIRKY